MASGYTLDDDVIQMYEDMKIRHTKHFIMLKVPKEGGKIVEDCHKDKTDKNEHLPYDELKEKLIEARENKEGRYCLFDFDYCENKDGNAVQKSKLCFMLWAPETASVKQKMLYSSSKDAVKKKLTGLACQMECFDDSDIDYDKVLKQVSKSD